MNSSQLKHLEAIRLYELKKVLSIISSEKINKDHLLILEIGAGAGWQAKTISEHGYTVEAIDINESNYLEQRVWGVKNYDGKNIPFADNYFDVIFSSSVLEHISHLEEFQKEMQRVLKNDGIAVHVVPGTAWRLWTSITHYPFLLKEIVKIIYYRFSSNNFEERQNYRQETNKISKLDLFKKMIFPNRHGEKGNGMSELYYFSKYYWNNIFQTNGWKIKKVSSNELFYTGYMFLGNMLSIPLRKWMSSMFGSSCYIFLLELQKLKL